MSPSLTPDPDVLPRKERFTRSKSRLANWERVDFGAGAESW